MRKINLTELDVVEESVDSFTGVLCFGPKAEGWGCGFACIGSGWCWVKA